MRRNLEKQGSVIRSFQETGGNSELQDEYDKVLVSRHISKFFQLN